MRVTAHDDPTARPRGRSRVPHEARRHHGSHSHECAGRSADRHHHRGRHRPRHRGRPNVNDVWVDAVMTTRPATTTGIRGAAEIMTARHLRHLPVAGDAGLVGVVHIIDVCRALIHAGYGRPQTGCGSGPSGTARPLDSPPPSCLSPAADPLRPETQNDPKLHSPAYRATPTSPAPPIAGHISIAAPKSSAEPSCSPVTRLVPAPMRQNLRWPHNAWISRLR